MTFRELIAAIQPKPTRCPRLEEKPGRRVGTPRG